MAYKCVVANLGSKNPSAVTFTKTSNFPTEAQAWEEVVIGNDHFAKFKIHYRKSIFNGNELTGFEISDIKEDDSFVPYDCFLDEQGRELEYILIGRYCSSSTSEANSVDAEQASMTIGTGRSLCRAKGTGYQQMDAAMYNFWRDLALAVSEKVDFNDGTGVDSYLGLARMNTSGYLSWWIDGLSHVYSVYLYSNKPSKYIDKPTESTDGYSTLSYAMPTANGCITKLGYDANHPTINYPSANNGSTSTFNTYYCDGSYYGTGERPCCVVTVGYTSANVGLFNLNGNFTSANATGVRLCYKPEYVPPAPSGGKTKFGTLTIVKKMFGNTEIVKEVLNGITIYEASTPPAPLLTKGDIIHFDALGDGTQKRFRVLDVNGNNIKLMSMDDSISSVFNSSSTTVTFDGGKTGQKYADSTLDTTLNTTYFNSLSATVQSAIIPESRIQRMYSFKNPDDPSYDYHQQYKFDATKMRGLPIEDQITIGNRNVYALDIKDIFDYFEKDTITSAELNEMFFETQSSINNKIIWTVSANANYADCAFCASGYYGYLDYYNIVSSCVVRPAFRINLTNIEYTKE